MINQLPTIYMINDDGTEQQISANKFRFEFATGERITVQLDNLYSDKRSEIVVRGYYGNDEYGYSDVNQKSVAINIRPIACNLICITPEVLG